MPVYIALFRGINVGGSNKLPMADLKALLADLGAADVRTYIQSGNAVFRHDGRDRDVLARRIGKAVEACHGFEPRVLVITPGQLDRAMADNPFPEAAKEGKFLHLFFLASTPGDPDREKLDSLKASTEDWRLDGDRFYLHAPEGIARSKLAAGAEKALGVTATARNWNTVRKLRDMARALDPGT